jgi:hypothetical protein
MEIRKIKKMISLYLIFACTVGFTTAQKPVKWTYSAKKISDSRYELQINAKIDEGWHIYSQNQPQSAIAAPTTITFNKNPLIKLKGKIQEQGKLKKKKEEVIDSESWWYEKEVSFVQLVELKGKTKTSVNGNIAFQVCTDEKCLPPTTISFNIPLKE